MKPTLISSITLSQKVLKNKNREKYVLNDTKEINVQTPRIDSLGTTNHTNVSTNVDKRIMENAKRIRGTFYFTSKGKTEIL